MARYSLVIRDQTYFTLMGIGAKTDRSMGRLLNDIIEDYVLSQNSEPIKKTLPIICAVKSCPNPAMVIVVCGPYEKFLCDFHGEAYVDSGKWQIKA